MTDNGPGRRIGDIVVESVDGSAAVARIESAVAAHTPLVVAFCNAHSVNLARHDAALVQSLEGALVLNDGIGVDLASRLLYGAPFPENLNGTDFTSRVLADIARPLRIFLIGGRPGVAEQAGDILGARYPRHMIVGVRDGYFATDARDSIFDEVAAAQPDLVLAAMGQPIQELWAAEYVARGPGVVMCIGAYLDFVAGVVPRAPTLVRTLRAEWLFRLAIEPRRLARRYLIGNFVFLAHVIGQRFAGDRG